MNKRRMFDAHALPQFDGSLSSGQRFPLATRHVNQPSVVDSSGQFDEAIHQTLWHSSTTHNDQRSIFDEGLVRYLRRERFDRAIDGFTSPLCQVDEVLVGTLAARTLLCETKPDSSLESCGRCSVCRQVDAETHPDLEIISKPADKSFIPVELFIGDRDHRMREGLCHRIAMKPFGGGRKIAVIDDADFLNQEGANCLLKTLEARRSPDLVISTSTKVAVNARHAAKAWAGSTG